MRSGNYGRGKKEIFEGSSPTNPEPDKEPQPKKILQQPQSDKIGFVSDLEEEIGHETDMPESTEGAHNIKRYWEGEPLRSKFVSTLTRLRSLRGGLLSLALVSRHLSRCKGKKNTRKPARSTVKKQLSNVMVRAPLRDPLAELSEGSCNLTWGQL